MAYIAFVDSFRTLCRTGTGEGGFGTPIRRHASTLPPSGSRDEFGTPIAGTYPPWYDGAYWSEGAITLNFLCLAKHTNCEALWAIISAYISAERDALLVGLLILVFLNGWRNYLHSLTRFWPIFSPALALFVLYALVYVETRYIGAAVVVAWLCLFAALPNVVPRRVADCVVLVVALSLLVTIFTGAAHDLTTRPVYTQWRIASDLRDAGVQSGESVAVLSAIRPPGIIGHT